MKLNKNRLGLVYQSRRQFLFQTAALAAIPLSSGWSLNAFAEAGDLSAGIQLWSVQNDVNEKPAETLARIAQFGYKKVETAGFGKLSTIEFRKILDDNGLRCTGAHQSYGSADQWQRNFDDANALGAQLSGSGMLTNGTGAHPIPEGAEGRGNYDWMRAMTLDDAKKTAELANRIGEAAKKEGLKYYYHNHPFEFVDFEGVCAYDVLLSETDPNLVDFQLDCGWAVVAGKDPIAILKAHPQRFSSLHIKNFLPLADGMVSNYQRRSTELSNGVIDYAPILAAAKEISIKHIYVEQESPFTTLQPMAAAEANVKYLEELKKIHQL